jgi:hypothetical protein
MDDLTYSLRVLCQRNRDGSHATQGDRMRTLTAVGTCGSGGGRFELYRYLIRVPVVPASLFATG